MNGTNLQRKTLYLDTRQATLRPDGRSLCVHKKGQTISRIPLRRVDHAVIQHAQADLLQACLAIINDGGSVHFIDQAGNPTGVLHHPWAEGSRWAKELANTIEHTSGHSHYQNWRNNQRRHAWSLVLRHNYRGDFEANRKLLIRYLLHFQPGIDVTEEIHWLDNRLWSWLDARLNREGYQPIIRVLQARGDELVQDLIPCLSIPLIWAYVRWRRHCDTSIIHERISFFEIQTRAPLANQLERHMIALNDAYHSHKRVDPTDGTILKQP